jgi:hypothetical protein
LDEILDFFKSKVDFESIYIKEGEEEKKKNLLKREKFIWKQRCVKINYLKLLCKLISG